MRHFCLIHGDCSQTTESTYFSFETTRTGAFVAIACPKTERFEIPVQGCLYMGKNCRQMSIRFPKMATNSNMQCEVQVGSSVLTSAHSLSQNNII